MKNTKFYFAGLAFMALAVSCSEENCTIDSEGSIRLSTSVCSDVEVISRASDQDLADNCMIWISNSRGLVRRYDGLSNVPSSIGLLAGHYIAEAWTGDSVSASWDKRWFKGISEFDVESGKMTEVSVTCKIANVVVSTSYDPNVDEVLKDYTLTVGHSRGTLTFDGRTYQKGYFMMPSTDKDLTYTVRGTLADGEAFEMSSTIQEAKPATEYVIRVKHTPHEATAGGGMFTIVVDDNEITSETEHVLLSAPKISGYGFNVATPIAGQEGTFGRRTLYISSATTLQDIEINSPYLVELLGLSGDGADLLQMSDEGAQLLESVGITFKCDPDPDGGTVAQINFEEDFTNSLTNGEYNFEIVAIDVDGRTSTVNLQFVVSDAPVMTSAVPAANISMHSVTLRGQVAKDGVEEVGFKFRKEGASEWTDIEGVPESRAFSKGSYFTATVNDLAANTTYEYAATSGSFIGAIQTVTTSNGPQLPNAGFEEWSGSKPMLICANEASMFWDSGNHGSKTAGKDITTAESSLKHSGNYSAKLQTASMFGVIAAGNIFTGHFLGTENMTKGILGWGRPWTAEPTALKFWAKYEPATFTKDNDFFKNGDLDNGIVYIALLDNSTMSYNGETWPVIVRTADLTNYSFKKDAPNVIAYGEHVFKAATAGNGLVEITIPIDYIRHGVTPTNILIVGSASQYGDYYVGAAGSTLYLDDMELIY